MARDKLITIRIEGEKREAFNNLAKSQNTDTASLLYDFISGCLDGTLDISLVTGKGNRIDKIDNQIDSERIDKLETDTQEIDNRLDTIAKKLNDWIEAFDDRLTDSDQGLGEKITSLENRLNTLAIQLDSQQIDRIDTDSQQIDDMKPLLKREKECSIATSPLPPSLPPDELDRPAIETVTPEVSPSPPSPPDAIGTLPKVESVEPNSSIETVASAIEDPEKKIMEPVGGSDSLDTLPVPPITDKTIDQNAIETVPGETDSSIETVTDAIELTNREKAAILGIGDSNLSKWLKNGEIPKKYDNKCRFNENKTKIILI